MLLSWLRLALRWISARQSALARAPRFSGRLFGLCLTWTLLFGFFAVARSRAVSELQLVRVQTLTFASTLTAVFVGLLMWTVMAALWGLVRIDLRRGQVRRYER